MKKIMFNYKFGLTDAVLAGRKTMTRRTVNIPGSWHGIDVYFMGPDTNRESLLLYDADESLIEDKNGFCGQIMPRYKVGEVVAVAQAYKDVIYTGGCPHPLVAKPGWNNKMYVRADLMPHQIRITSVRLERIQDISKEDCLREGIIQKCGVYGIEGLTEGGNQLYFSNPRIAFAYLIMKMAGKKAWYDNPWVFVYEFELVK